jgi:glycerophosphoryl diester phosphodiesterase
MLDADGVELDIHATRDGAIVVHHDPDVQGCGPIALLTLAEARQVRLPNGETLPLLQEVLDLVGDNDVWVEVKSLVPAHDRALLEVLDSGPAPRRYAVHSFDHCIVHRLGETWPGLRRGILQDTCSDDPVASLQAAGATMLWQQWQQVDQHLVRRIHEAGVGIIAWTLNEIGDLERLVRLGVDGL